jgi:hypothetical protein
MRSHLFTRISGIAAAAAVVFSLAQPAAAGCLFTRTPVLHVTFKGVESQAKLADQLRAEGYSNVVLASGYPTTTHPYPQLEAARTSHPENVPVREGWNGVAMKNGETYQVYANRT